MIGRITIAAVALTTLVAIAWVRAESPTLADSAPEASLSTDVPRDREVEVGGSFEIEVSLRNKGGVGDHGGISVSFPDLATGNVSSSKRFTSDLADIEVDEFTDGLGDVVLHGPGDDIWHANVYKFPARHLLVESDSSPWENGDSRTLTLTVHANEPGELEIRVRGWICRSRYDECSRDPSGKSRKDQQGHSVDRYTIDIIEHTAELTSCQGSPNPVATDQTLTLRARVFVPRNAARKPLHVEFGFNGGRYETDDIRVDRGKRKTFTYQLTPPSPGNYYLSCRLFADDKRVDTRYATSRVRVAVPPPSPPVIVSMTTQVVSPVRGAVIGASGSSMSIRVKPGESVELRAGAEDRNGNLVEARWNARHALMSIVPDRFTSSSLRQTGDFTTNFPIEGTFNVDATFVDARGASATARWSITVDDGRDDRASAAGQLLNLRQSYAACATAEAVCRVSNVESELSELAARYTRSFEAELGEDAIAKFKEFLDENGLAEFVEDVREASLMYSFGSLCGEPCWSMGLDGTDHLFYSVGWMLIGSIPIVDLFTGARDAGWTLGYCVGSAMLFISRVFFGGEKRGECDSIGLGINLLAVVPVVGKPFDGAKIVRHAINLAESGKLDEAADFAIAALKPFGGTVKHLALAPLRNSDKWFGLYLKIAYPKIRGVKFAESEDVSKGMTALRTALRGDVTYGDGLGAHYLFQTLERAKFHGATVVHLGLKVPKPGTKKKLVTDIDVVLEFPDGRRWWVEPHAYKDIDELKGKADSLNEAKEIVDNKPDKIFMEVFAPVKYHDLTLKSEIEAKGISVEFHAPASTQTAAEPVATPAPVGRIRVVLCNQTSGPIAPEIAVGLWGSSLSWVEGDEIAASSCAQVHDETHEEGEYLTFLRTASGERVLSDWNHILAGARVERRFFWRDDAVCSGAPTCGGEQPITATEPTDALRPSDLLTSSTSTGPLIGPVPMAPTAATEPTDTLQPSDLLTSATSTEPLIGTDIPISMRTVGEAGDIGGPAPSEYGGVSDALVAGYRGLGGSLTRRHVPPFARRRRNADAPRGNAPHDSAALGRGFRRFRARQRASPLGCASVRCCMVLSQSPVNLATFG